ncbi:MAG TPA: GSU2403 family nucleotidyltransferase fold protein [bacterium]|nr:GSU2403 family nucleotidyltransferase fold protein [bacterium]
MMQLDLATKTLFAEFQETVRARAAIEAELAEGKTYVRKTVKGKVYWYEQRYEGGQARQKYFGPSGEENDGRIGKAREACRDGKALLKKLAAIEARQAAMLRKSGLPVLDRRMALLLGRFSDVGLIHRSGVLIGTLAYAAYSGMMGHLFERSTLTTQDIDIARDDSIEVASPVIDLKSLLAERGLECRAVPSLSKKALPSSYVTSDGIRIDFLVPLRGKEREIVRMPRVAGAGATPLRFLDYLIEDPIEAVLVAPAGGILVTVPRPERFAIHKLIVAAYRPVTESAKREKDLHQAGQLIAVLAEEQGRELKAAFRVAAKAGKKWERAIGDSRESLPENVRRFLK